MSVSLFGLLIVALGMLIPLAVIVGGILLVLKLVDGVGSGTDRRQQAEETQMIQDMHRSLSKMEGRVEAMETILFDAPAVARKAEHDAAE